VCVSICVFIYVCMYTCTYIYIYIYKSIYIHVCIYVHMLMCVCVGLESGSIGVLIGEKNKWWNDVHVYICIHVIAKGLICICTWKYVGLESGGAAVSFEEECVCVCVCPHCNTLVSFEEHVVEECVIYVCIYVYICIHVYIYIYICIHIYIYMPVSYLCVCVCVGLESGGTAVSTEEKKKWWNDRAALDRRLHLLVQQVQQHWFDSDGTATRAATRTATHCNILLH